jgi:hypothetical protein
MSQFLVFYPQYWSSSSTPTPSPPGVTYTTPESPDQGPQETWSVINSFASLSDAYAAADAAATTYAAKVYDRDNQVVIYAASPFLASLVAAGSNTDASLQFLTTKMDQAAYLAFERAQIEWEVWAQIVVTKDPQTGAPLSNVGSLVTTGFYANPHDMPSFLAILRDATTRPRTSGQTGSTVAAVIASEYGDTSSQVAAHWTA